MKKTTHIDIFELADKKVSLSDLLALKFQTKKEALQKPTLKRKYIRFEIEHGKHTSSHSKIVGFFIQKTNNEFKEEKEVIFSVNNSSNNPLLEILLPILNSVAFENLSEYLLIPGK